ncbi:DNA-binding transcriptional regulator, LysR family [Sphingomonas sp. EC-HK361]|uniref:LysR family transcriptional regulator n=1 Tax=Sphingomonas sp. EC-HK361 TaxID=2038397 RepID=UPI0012540735|nr:LysR family transcriptional regulator [Sphingomonas sp. EC-HK361]VVT20760.1 DNA-binding transcriptional regulator, LysR family [Sphingomonas sp. EC-HK361]
MNETPSWDLFRTFAAVLREGSLSAAARALGLTQPSVSRHIEALEGAIGEALFVRSQRGLLPTERALALQPFAEDMVATSAALLRTAAAGSGMVSGTVRVTASEMVAIEHLPPILADIRRQHAALAIELVASNLVGDLLQRQADVAIRMVAPAQQALIAKRVGAVAIGLHARADYLERRGMPASLADLAAHDLIGPDSEPMGTRAVLDALPGLERSSFALRTDSHAAQLAAIRAGFGIGICQSGIAARDPALVPVLPQAFTMTLPIWIVMHENLRSSVAVRTVFDALAEAFAGVR